MRGLLTDDEVHRYSGLEHYTAHLSELRKYRYGERRREVPFPRRHIVSPLYIGYDDFAGLPQAGTYRAFFVQRDPRDLLVSWYHSVKYSHPESEGILAIRAKLHETNKEDGLLYSIDWLHDFGFFEALRSWVAPAVREDPNARVFRYEDLTGDKQFGAMSALFSHCGLSLPEALLRRVLERHAFERKAARMKGEEDHHAHLRKGVSGDWPNHFTERVARHFEHRTYGLVSDLGYAGENI
jgi:hypothetical protein